MKKKQQSNLHRVRKNLIAYLNSCKIYKHGNQVLKFATNEQLAELYNQHSGQFIPYSKGTFELMFDIHPTHSPNQIAVLNTPKIMPMQKIIAPTSYKEQLKTKEWLGFRIKIMRRDGFECQMCMGTINLQVHHKRYIDGKMAWEYPDNYVTTVCGTCHKKFHKPLLLNN